MNNLNFRQYLKTTLGYSEGTVSLYCKYAFEFEGQSRDVNKYLEKYNSVSNTTRRVIISAIKKYLKFLGENSWENIDLPRKNIVEKDFLTFTEYREIIQNIKISTKKGLQRRVVIRILFETGIRSSELLSICQEDIQENKIKIYGKGNKERFVFISKWLQSELEMYIKTIQSRKIFNFGYKNLYEKVRKSYKKKKIAPHDLRRGFANYCHLSGVPIYDISIMMGHENINTTAQYIKRSSAKVNVTEIFS